MYTRDPWYVEPKEIVVGGRERNEREREGCQWKVGGTRSWVQPLHSTNPCYDEPKERVLGGEERREKEKYINVF